MAKFRAGLSIQRGLNWTRVSSASPIALTFFGAGLADLVLRSGIFERALPLLTKSALTDSFGRIPCVAPLAKQAESE